MLGIRFSMLPVLLVVIASILQPLPAVAEKKRVAVVSSYHREYLWSQDTNAGLVSALQKFGYLDNEQQAEIYTRTDQVESSSIVLRKLWMDSKRRSRPDEIRMAVSRLVHELERFRPDIILLGDDNATNYIGNHFLDSQTPVVFWGVNGSPLKYRLLDSLDVPGHNITGIYQAGYLKEGIEQLLTLVPDIRTLAVLSDASPTGRSKAKELKRMERRGELPVKIVGMVVTNSLEQWKRDALELSKTADAFFVLNHNTLKHGDGSPIGQMEVGAWYLQNIRKPDVSHEKQFVIEGMLCAVDDSGFKQGFEAIRIAHRILSGGEDPATIAAYAPEPGGFIVNLERARMLGLEDEIRKSTMVNETIKEALALSRQR